ncbi:hypothetical protein PAXRUDRAFT_51304, partial [Paxillus rubicundulus Ve08.2h10]
PGSNRNDWCEGDSLASSDTRTFISTSVVQRPATAQTDGANSACTHTPEGISTQKGDGCEESQEGSHGGRLIDG